MERMLTNWQLLELFIQLIVTEADSTLSVLAHVRKLFIEWDNRQCLPKRFAKTMIEIWPRSQSPGKKLHAVLRVAACASSSTEVEHAKQQQKQAREQHRRGEDDSLIELQLERRWARGRAIRHAGLLGHSLCRFQEKKKKQQQQEMELFAIAIALSSSRIHNEAYDMMKKEETKKKICT